MRANKLADAIRYVYVMAADMGTHIYTVAYTFDDEGKQIIWNYAECSPKDRFVKSMGRTLAAGRLIANSKTHRNKVVPYSECSESVDGVMAPRYHRIAEELYIRATTLSR